MRYAVGYPVWNKADMISWYMEGIRTNMQTYPQKTTVIFCLSDCTDDSLAQFQRYARNILEDFRVLPPIILQRKPGAPWITESEQHNALLQRFMADDQCDVLIVPQDDMKFNGNEHCVKDCKRPVLEHLDRIFEKYGPKVGCVTGRDTFYNHFSESAGSWWSASKLKYRLQPGEFRQGYLVNRGPVVYPRRMVEAIGYLDIEFIKVGFTETEYAARAHHAGFVNGALGMDILHTKFGKFPDHTVDYQKQEAEDIKFLLQRYPDASPW